jgi:hypothetical protein
MDCSRVKLSMSNKFCFGDKYYKVLLCNVTHTQKCSVFRIEAHKEMRLERDAFCYNRGQYFLISLLVNSKQKKTFLYSWYTNRNSLDTSRGHF